MAITLDRCENKSIEMTRMNDQRAADYFIKQALGELYMYCKEARVLCCVEEKKASTAKNMPRLAIRVIYYDKQQD